MKKLFFALIALATIGLLAGAALFAQGGVVSCTPNPTGCTLTLSDGTTIQFKKPDPKRPGAGVGAGARIIPRGPAQPDSMVWDSLRMSNETNGFLTLDPTRQSTGEINPSLGAGNLSGNRLAAASTNTIDFFFLISDPGINGGAPVRNMTPFRISGQIHSIPPGPGTRYQLQNAPVVLADAGSGAPVATVTAATVIVGGSSPALTTYGLIVLAGLLVLTAIWLFWQKRRVPKGGVA